MKSLESMERETPEFERLTPGEQNERRQVLSLALGTIIKNALSSGLSEKEMGMSVGAHLELYLTGKIERLPYEEKPPRKTTKTKTPRA